MCVLAVCTRTSIRLGVELGVESQRDVVSRFLCCCCVLQLCINVQLFKWYLRCCCAVCVPVLFVVVLYDVIIYSIMCCNSPQCKTASNTMSILVLYVHV